MDAIILQTMTSEEARTCVTEINNNLRSTRSLLLDLYEREGWKALGYTSWRECVTTEFKQHQSYLYRQLEAAKAEKNILPILKHSPIDEIPESHLRPLSSLSLSDQREAYQRAIETAPDGKVTAKQVEEIAREIRTARRQERKKRVDRLKNTPQKPEAMSDEFRRAYEAMARAIVHARDTGWEATDRVTAVKHIVMLLNIASGRQEATSLSAPPATQAQSERSPLTLCGNL
ncbi:MAG: hypothetical protein M0P30_10690 [Syntrophorhabdaceae bacterium]|nr:hypothetical protein [Syntrophorhabdaceae bacterium]